MNCLKDQLEKISIHSTHETPDAVLDPDQGTITISGEMRLLHALDFFAPILKWVRIFFKTTDLPLKIYLDVGYMSDSAIASMYGLISIARNCHQKGKDVTFYWHYPINDEDLLEEGEDYQRIAGFPFYLVERK